MKGKTVQRIERSTNPRFIRRGKYAVTSSFRIAKGKIVIKRVHPILTQKEAEKTAEWHKRYIEAVRKFGINIPPTETRIYKTKLGPRISIFQQAFEKEELLEQVLKTGGKKVVQEAFGKLADQACKLIIFNQQLGTTGNAIYINIMPSSFAYRNGELQLLDTFFPLMVVKGETNVDLAKLFAKRYKIVNPKDLVASKLDPAKILRKTLFRAVQCRPDLKGTFRQKLQEAIRNNFPKEKHKQYLRHISPARMAAVTAYRKFLHRFILRPEFRK